ncbi:MAG: ASCH domain-containing protein [Pyrinomonadaceae bacterium]
MTEIVEHFWADFCGGASSVRCDEPYQVWYFGSDPAMALELVGLVLEGKKTATASLAKTNDIEPQNAPVDDGYSVVTDFEGRPMCVIQTTEIRHLPFADVDAAFAADEGEGDRSLAYWRQVHHDYFTREAAKHGFEFDETSIVCCERFRLVYPQ